MTQLFIVRHKVTGLVLKDFKGASHWDPEGLLMNWSEDELTRYSQKDAHASHYLQDPRPPRLFSTKKGAVNFISSWLRGRAKLVSNDVYRGAGGYMTDEPSHDLVIEKVPGRRRDQLEIVPVILTFGEPM